MKRRRCIHRLRRFRASRVLGVDDPGPKWQHGQCRDHRSRLQFTHARERSRKWFRRALRR